MKWYTHKRGKYIAITEKEGAGNPKWDVARTYTDEHARLISSAPDLLEACVEILDLLERETPTPWYLRKHYIMLTEAIRRATGD